MTTIQKVWLVAGILSALCGIPGVLLGMPMASVLAVFFATIWLACLVLMFVAQDKEAQR